MSGQSERINTPISTAELQRRWMAIRAGMEQAGVDVLVMQNNNDYMGGYVKYFTDQPALNGYPITVVFPRDDDMTLVTMGPFSNTVSPPTGNELRGVKTHMTTPGFASAPFTARYDAELAEKALARYGAATIGFVSTNALSHALGEQLRNAFPRATFVDATDLVDAVKVVKSPEEIALIRRTTAMQDAAMQAAFAAITPGMRDHEVAAVAQAVSQSYGSEQGIFLCASAPIGVSVAKGGSHKQNRVIEAGDQFALLVENNGPGGFYTELGRTCVLGRASDEMKDEFDLILRAQDFAANLLRPGASCSEIWETYNQFMRDNKRPEERRLYCHGQGYDLVERPLVRFDETMRLTANMNLALHPTYKTERTYSWICDNYLILEGGQAERIHDCPRTIVELG